MPEQCFRYLKHSSMAKRHKCTRKQWSKDKSSKERRYYRKAICNGYYKNPYRQHVRSYLKHVEQDPYYEDSFMCKRYKDFRNTFFWFWD